MALPRDATVLLIRLSAMGDVLFSLETLTSLKTESTHRSSSLDRSCRISFLVAPEKTTSTAGPGATS